MNQMEIERTIKIRDLQKKVKEQLESKGLFVEELTDEIGLSISLTQFGVSTMHAMVSQVELEYFIDNDLEI